MIQWWNRDDERLQEIERMFEDIDRFIKNTIDNFCVSVHMNHVATHEFSEDFAEGLKVYLDSVELTK